MRGEQLVGASAPGASSRITPACAGSSAATSAPRGRHGITPACAGSSDDAPHDAYTSRDHPRVRGEQPHPGARVTAVGSPPRARGAAADQRGRRGCAGSPPRARGAAAPISRLDRERDHPRVRGEQRRTSTDGGSRDHPRVRGEQAEIAQMTASRAGITPACAGSRAAPGGPYAAWWDHPRVRGEQPVRPESRGPWDHPRVRGEQSPPRGSKRASGITPACAGSRAGLLGGHGRLRDHPRVRGEQDTDRVASSPTEGSPPRARGAGSWRPSR